MPELRCTVQTCVHNSDFYCDLKKINVGGSDAKRAEETCCDSFEERRSATFSNVIHEPATPTSDIDCKAVECQYNQSCKCHAGKISVEGSQATTNSETECATFTK